MVPVALAGSGVLATGKVDLAIVEFTVPRSFTLGRSRSHDDDDDRAPAITINLVVENRGTVDQPRQATVTGTLNGTGFTRRASRSPRRIGRRKSFAFPSYTPTSSGDIRWTVVIADDVSANSTASATTTSRQVASRFGSRIR